MRFESAFKKIIVFFAELDHNMKQESKTFREKKRH